MSAVCYGQALMLDKDGHFETHYIPEPGINHLDFVVTPYGSEELDLRRSFLYGVFTPWDAPAATTATAKVQSQGLEKAARALEASVTPARVQELLLENMDEESEFQVHEIRFDRIESSSFRRFILTLRKWFLP